MIVKDCILELLKMIFIVFIEFYEAKCPSVKLQTIDVRNKISIRVSQSPFDIIIMIWFIKRLYFSNLAMNKFHSLEVRGIQKCPSESIIGFHRFLHPCWIRWWVQPNIWHVSHQDTIRRILVTICGIRYHQIVSYETRELLPCIWFLRQYIGLHLAGWLHSSCYCLLLNRLIGVIIMHEVWSHSNLWLRTALSLRSVKPREKTCNNIKLKVSVILNIATNYLRDQMLKALAFLCQNLGWTFYSLRFNIKVFPILKVL